MGRKTAEQTSPCCYPIRPNRSCHTHSQFPLRGLFHDAQVGSQYNWAQPTAGDDYTARPQSRKPNQTCCARRWRRRDENKRQQRNDSERKYTYRFNCEIMIQREVYFRLQHTHSPPKTPRATSVSGSVCHLGRTPHTKSILQRQDVPPSYDKTAVRRILAHCRVAAA